MTDPAPERGVTEHVAEALVFAPLGLALEARHLWPTLVDRGRGQVKLARATGHRALLRYQQWLEDQVAGVRREAEAAGRGLGLLPEPAAEPPVTVDEPTVPASAPAVTPAPAEAVETRSPAVAVESLAIPDYDSLSASQVVPRLAALGPQELEAVWQYESAGRGRKTILNKIVQLRTG